MPLVLLFLLLSDWPQFGGPNRNFQTEASGIASSWPAAGPKKLWSRQLGEGYSAISVDNGILYTMYRRGNQEVVLAAQAATGKTIWEYAYDAPPATGMNMQFGPGPHATPLIVGERVFTVAITTQLHALDRKTGKVLWMKDLRKQFPGATEMDRGYSGSPLAYKDTVILQIGGPKHSVIALRQSDGSTVWTGGSFTNSPSSPSLFDISGQKQLVIPMSNELVGMDPDTGAVLWTHNHPTDYGLNVSLPVIGPENVIVLSSAYSGGSRAIQLTRSGGKASVKELWAHKQMRVHHGTIIQLGGYIYGSSGDFGPAPITAVEMKTGKIAWRDRTLPKSNFVLADGKLVILDEDGNLAVATVSPEGMRILAKAPLLTNNSWTAPTITGTTMYARDRKSMVAVDLK